VILLGLILIIVAVGVAGWLYTSTESMSNRSDLDAFNVAVGMTPLQLVIAGAVVVLLLWLGLILVRSGAVRSSRRRRERKEEARRAEEERVLAEEEAEERLATQTARERAAAAEGEVESLRREHGTDDGTGVTDPDAPTGTARSWDEDEVGPADERWGEPTSEPTTERTTEPTTGSTDPRRPDAGSERPDRSADGPAETPPRDRT
jgi:hypothetical protein